jgi:ferredoxin
MRGVKMSVSVVIEPRENCIMCCNCHSNCPEIFETSDVDGKSQIREEHRVGDEIDNGVVDESLEDCARVAVDLCPVSIIYVES